MKGFTVIQPWASLLAKGIKRYETRSWAAPSYLIGERIAICAGKKKPQWTPELAAACRELNISLQTACVVGIATFAENIPMTEAWIETVNPVERIMGHYEPGRWAWRFEKAEPLAICPPVRGKLGFFEVEF